MPSTTLITTPQLARLIGVSQAPAIVDVRIDDDYRADPRLLAGSVRKRPLLGLAMGRRVPGQIGCGRVPEGAKAERMRSRLVATRGHQRGNPRGWV